MGERARLLVCERQKELEPVLASHLEALGARVIVVNNPDALPVLAREHRPQAILVNIPGPANLCHRLKMNPALYFVPLFVFVDAGEDDDELSFLSNELFRKPFETGEVLSRLRRYLVAEPGSEPADLASRTRDRWIEKKVRNAYLFEYVGDLTMDKIEGLLTRLSELLAVGRREFTVQLLQARHAANLPAAAFLALDALVAKSGGTLKLVMPVTPLAEELARHGMDVDEYVPRGDLTADRDAAHGDAARGGETPGG